MPDDERLADLLGDVTPIRRSGRVEVRPPKPAPRPLQREADDAAVMREILFDHELLALEGAETGEELAFRRDGVQERTWRRLRRGVFRVGAELDLHGMRGAEAKAAVRAFLLDCRARDLRCVRIIHGKGRHSDGRGPVLKQLVDLWLRQRDEVLAFCSCRPAHGGTGAVYVLLRRMQGTP